MQNTANARLGFKQTWLSTQVLQPQSKCESTSRQSLSKIGPHISAGAWESRAGYLALDSAHSQYLSDPACVTDPRHEVWELCVEAQVKCADFGVGTARHTS
eukprot:951385-Rhodomonas_salina.1